MPVINLDKKTWLATRVVKADSFLSRLIGLLLWQKLGPEEALWLTRCKGIHTVGMKFPIDVIFLDGSQTVVGTLRSVKPYRFSRFYLRCRSVLELPIGSIKKSHTEVGDQLDVSMAEDWAHEPSFRPASFGEEGGRT